MQRFLRRISALLALLALPGCDPQRIKELEEGVSTEADVRARFGEPERIWGEPSGERVLEYNRQPAGHQNYMISIGPDGKMSALRQVLNPGNFARVQPGMPMEEVRRMLGKPMKITPYALKNEDHPVCAEERDRLGLALPAAAQHLDGVHGVVQPRHAGAAHQYRPRPGSDGEPGRALSISARPRGSGREWV
jgi:hypothetical protein